MEDKFKRITQAQFDLWIDNPVTKAYLQCLEWSAEKISEALGKGALVASDNNDTTCNAIHSALGQQGGFRLAQSVQERFLEHEMLAIPEEGDSDDSNN